ncbi:hypothetical protein EsH8_III_001351 [Colletotrichum jinshuiense]
MRSSLTLLASASLAAVTAAAPWQCPPLGDVLPKAKNPSANPAVRAALDAFVASVEAEAATFNGSAISIGVKSAVEDEAMLDFHFTPRDKDPLGAQVVDKHTVYRLASVSKVFAVLAALQKDDVIGWEDPIVKFIPELRDAPKGTLDYVDWEDVTVEAASAHIGGIPTDMMTDNAAYPGDWEALGLPPVSEEEKPACGGFLGVPSCTRNQFLDAVKLRRPPIYPAYQTPVYSNIGTTLVGLVVEGATNKTFEEVLFESILEPADMGNTTYGKVPEKLETMFIPINDTYYKHPLGIFDAAGGIYSTTDDMLKFGDAILQNRLLSPAKTRKWLKPTAFTSAMGSFVGKPWEGIVSDNVTSNGRVVELYTKGGDLVTYHSALVVVPEYGITVSILVAGLEVSQAFFGYYSEKISDLFPPLIKALDEAARDEARDAIVGRYADEESNSTLTLSMDGGWGLVLEDWFMKGFEVIPNLRRYSFLGVNFTELPPDTERTARIYPTGLEAGNTTAWRALYDTFPAEARQQIDDLMFFPNGSCVSWLTMDRATYNYKGLDHFEFTYGDDGKVESVLPKAFALSLNRVEKEAEAEARDL